MRKEKVKRLPWNCLCKAYLPAPPQHEDPEDCARFLERELARSQADLVALKTHFGMNSGHSDGGRCVCGGPLFKFSNPPDATRICPFCAARYIQYLKGELEKR